MAGNGSGPGARRAGGSALVAVLCIGLVACQPGPGQPVPNDPTGKSDAKPPPWARFVGEVRTLSPNAGWCWWQSRRAVLADGNLLVGSVPNVAGPGGTTRVTQVLSMNLATKATRTATLGTNAYRDDDHNSPGLVVNPDNSVTAAYTGHGNDNVMRLRTLANPAGGTWKPLPNAIAPSQAGANLVTYANPVRSEGLLWNFTRRDNRTWVTWSDDNGKTWTGAWLLLEKGNGTPEHPNHRPYVHVAANPALDRIDFVTTAGHPKDINSTALYSGYLKGMNVYRTDGALVGPLVGQPGYRPQDLTLVAAPPNIKHLRSDISEPARSRYSDADLWGSDLVVDAGGNPALVYSMRLPYASSVPGKLYDHSYHWARWNGSAWVVTRVSGAGSELFAGEQDYTGLITLDPSNPYRLVMSSDVDPVTSTPLRSGSDGKVHHEIFEGLSTDGGATWGWRPVTTNSTKDNIRPLLATDELGRWALVWLRGTYSSWITWSMGAMVMTGPGPSVTGIPPGGSGDKPSNQ